MRYTGKVRSWNEQKGFGFIHSAKDDKDLFVHITALSNRERVPRVGQTITYTLSTDKQGRPCAVQALLPGDQLSSPKGNWEKVKAIVISVTFLSIVAFLTFSLLIPSFILWGYLAISVITFLVYAFDKTAAKDGAWRTPESTLHWLAVAGGWPGALIAQQAIRHKSKKQSFRAVFWMTVIINCGVITWFCTPGGTQTLQAWISAVFSGGHTATIEWSDKMH